jgi:hypothetical protein
MPVPSNNIEDIPDFPQFLKEHIRISYYVPIIRPLCNFFNTIFLQRISHSYKIFPLLYDAILSPFRVN